MLKGSFQVVSASHVFVHRLVNREKIAHTRRRHRDLTDARAERIPLFQSSVNPVFIKFDGRGLHVLQPVAGRIVSISQQPHYSVNLSIDVCSR